ncbi:hypothetical protein AYO40_01235 [Planctomycetaceae bacterium SCGC AG-212-D15]|nr:hypothetical protein AYO40_01235 [Planctomycetaceae bacterium SCGC AG-212-D15]
MAINITPNASYVPKAPTITDLTGPQASPPNTNNGHWSSYHIQSSYGNYDIAVSHYWDNGIIQGPIMGPGSPTLLACKRISWAAPFGIKTVSWSASRSGAPPRKPNPLPTDPNLTLKNFTFTNMSTDLDADGSTLTYSCSGLYVYIMTAPLPPTAGYPSSHPDFDDFTLGAMATQPNEFISGII